MPTGQKASQPRSRKRRSAKQSQTNSLRFPQLELVDPNHHEVSTTFDKAPPLSPERQSHVLSDDSSATPAAGDGTDVSHRVPPHVFTEEDEPTVTTVIEELDVNVLAHILQEPSIHSEPAELDDLNANLPANKSDGGTDGPDERHTAASTEERAHAEISQAEQDTVDVDDDLDARPERLTSPLTSIVPLRRRRIEVVTSVEVEDEGPSQPAPKFIPRLKSSMREKSPDQPGADSSQNTRIGRRVTFSDDVQVTTIFSEDDDHLDREHSESESERSSDEDEENNDRDNERLGRGSHVSSIAHDDSDEESEQSDDESASSRSRASTEDIESDEEYRETSSVRSGDETSQGLDCKDSHEDFVPDSEAGSFERGLDENVAARILPVRMTRSWTRMAVDAANLQYQQDRSNWEGTGASIDSDSEDLLAGQSGDGNVLQSHFFSNGGARSAQGDEASVDEGALKEDEEMMLEVADKAAVVSDQDCLTKEAFLLRRKHNLQKVYLHKWRRELRRVVVDLGM